MPEHHFETPEPTELVIEIGRGSVRVHATDTDSATTAAASATTHVEVTGPHAEEAVVRQSGDVIAVVGPRQGLAGLFSGDPHLDVTVTLPSGSRLVTRLGSADLVVTGSIGASRLKSGSGDISLETVSQPAVVQTGSGDVVIGTSHGNLKLQTGSGDISIGTTTAAVSISTGSGDISLKEAVAPTVVKSGSGDVMISSAAADLSLTTSSGDLLVREVSRGRVSARSTSGEVAIGVLAGVPVWTDVHTVSGRIHSGLQGAGQPEPGQDHLELRASTVSGDVVLTEV